MAGLDPFRLSRTLAYLLRGGPPATGLGADPEGWFSFEDVARAATEAIHRPVNVEDVTFTLTRFGGARFEVGHGRVRISATLTSVVRFPPRRPESVVTTPDILYHATTRSRIPYLVERDALLGFSGGPVHLVRAEPHAWRVGWRSGADPIVLYVDMARARRDGVTVGRTKSGQFVTDAVPLRHVLNLREGFAEQASAGGFLVDWSSGSPRIALIRVNRRQGATWEVAKGKLETGEVPERAAVREVREEMGVDVELTVSRALGTIRYGFSTPEGEPRLKTIYLYLIEADRKIAEFHPSEREGIEAVEWFPVEEAVNLLSHPSLRSSIGRLLGALEDRAMELGLVAK